MSLGCVLGKLAGLTQATEEGNCAPCVRRPGTSRAFSW